MTKPNISLDKDQAKYFSDEFLSKYLNGGFGNMPKREIDILIFHLLNQTDFIKGKDNHDIAALLKITESKVKSLRLDTNARYTQLSTSEALQKIAIIFFDTYSSKLDISEENIEFNLEEPVLRKEFEYATKKIGRFVQYTLNDEVLKIKAEVFVEVFLANFDESIKNNFKGNKGAKEVFNSSLPISVRIEKFLSAHSNKIGAVNSLISTVLTVV